MKILVDGKEAARVIVTRKGNSRLIVPQNVRTWIAAYRKIFPHSTISTESEFHVES
jgi:hypothetical protein